MRLARISIVATAIIALGAQLCAGAELSQVVRSVEEGYKTLDDLQADFNQKSTLKAMRREEKGGGVLYIKKAGAGKDAMFRFDYVKPKQQIVSNGTTVWYYLPDQKQVMVMDMARMFSDGNGVALNYLAGMGHVSRDFDIAFAQEKQDKKGNYLLDLTPKKKSAAMKRLELAISGDAVDEFVAKGRPATPFPIVSSTVVDQAGNSTRIEYDNVKTNRGLESGRFNFKVPSGVEVIRK